MRLFAWIAPFLYLGFALITPPFQTPDEHQHLFRAWQLSSGHLLGKREGNESGGDLPPALARAAARELGSAVPHAESRPLTKTRFVARFEHGTIIAPNEVPRFTNFLGSVYYSPAGYGPQIIAVEVGRGFSLSVEAIVRLGRVLNALLALLLFWAAFRVLPVGRLVLLVVALLPMTAACAGSFGQDGLIIAGTAWLIALCMRAMAEGEWSRSSAAVLIALAVTVTLAKMVYLPLVLLPLLARKIRVDRLRWWLPPVLAGIVAAVLLAGWLRMNAGISVPMHAGMPEPRAQVDLLVHHPLKFVTALAHTYTNWRFLIGQIFTFGWLNVGPVVAALWLSLAALILAVISGDPRGRLLSPIDRAWTMLMLAAIVILLSLALYIAGTPLGADRIAGLQGRYFIPLILPLLLVCLPMRSDTRYMVPLVIAGLLVCADVAALQAIVRAYYV